MMDPHTLNINFVDKSEGEALYKHGKSTLSILGSPVYRYRLDNEAIRKEILQYGIERSFIADLDGSFLIIYHNEEDKSLVIANDRFASIPFYYYYEGKDFIGSLNYSDIWTKLGSMDRRAVNKEAFYEFLHFQRLLGDKTYDKKTKYLNSASILYFDEKRRVLKTEKYWRPDFSNVHKSPNELSRIFADLVSESIYVRTSDNKRYGLLLSGGLDSRLVLAALRKPIECITIGSCENNEYIVARELACRKGYSHSFVKRCGTHYADILEDAVFLGSAMNVYDHAHFLDLGDSLKTKADVFLHGHGFDYMFQGKYLPVTRFKIFGKNTYLKRMKNIGRQSIKDYFFSRIGYSLKSIEPLSLVIGEKRGSIREYIYSSLEEILQEGYSFCGNVYDLWEYLIMHNLSRHYTFLNIASIRTFAEERTPAFANNLFDFYLSLPAKSRLNRSIFTNAIRLLDKRLYKIRNANTNCNIYDSDLMLTAKLALNKTLDKIGFKILLPPAQKERSWPIRADIIRNSDKMQKLTKDIADSDYLRMLGFLDMDKIRSYVETHLSGKGDYSDLILTLVTIDTFLKME